MVALPTIDQVRRGHRKYQKKEPREAMYRTASFLVGHFWGRPREIADSLGVLLLTWNSAFYRQGSFDFGKLEDVVASEQKRLTSFRGREILTYLPNERPSIGALFVRFLDALQLSKGEKRGTKSPVAVAKALHLLAPRFFPLWDGKIARAYRCGYGQRPAQRQAEKYLSFLEQMKSVVEHLVDSGATDAERTSLLKLVDEYNYVRFTLA